MRYDDSEDEDRPWERPGAFRRDCEPHRGDLLFFLGRLSIVFGALSLCVVPLAVIGLPLGVTILLLSARDLRQMSAGLMDPAGATLVRAARRNAAWATGIALSAGPAWVWIVLWWPSRVALGSLGLLGVIAFGLFDSQPWRLKRARDK